MPEIKHAEVPYKVGTSKIERYGIGDWNVTKILSDKGYVIATVQSSGSNGLVDDKEKTREQAAFIVKACNTHELLVEVLKAARGCVKYYDEHEGAPVLLQQVDHVLKKVGEE